MKPGMRDNISEVGRCELTFQFFVDIKGPVLYIQDKNSDFLKVQIKNVEVSLYSIEWESLWILSRFDARFDPLLNDIAL